MFPRACVPPDAADTEVVRHPQQPVVTAFHLEQAARPARDLQKRFLNHVLGGIVIPEESPHEAQEGLLVPSEKCAQRLRVPRLGIRLEEIPIGHVTPQGSYFSH
jgi:hypothetical protein